MNTRLGATRSRPTDNINRNHIGSIPTTSHHIGGFSPPHARREIGWVRPMSAPTRQPFPPHALHTPYTANTTLPHYHNGNYRASYNDYYHGYQQNQRREYSGGCANFSTKIKIFLCVICLIVFAVAAYFVGYFAHKRWNNN